MSTIVTLFKQMFDIAVETMIGC